MIDRREFMRSTLAASVLASLSSMAVAAMPVAAREKRRTEFHVFSKNFMFLDREHLCETMAAAGLDGIEWCVRSGGHVEPTRVREEMPRAVEAAHKQGLKSIMVCTRSKCDGTDAPKEGDIVETLKVCADCGVRIWRPGGFVYDGKLSVEKNMDIFRRKLARMEEISRETGVQCNYQNHFETFGGAVFDLWEIAKDLDPRYFALQYDIMHAAFELPVSWERVLRQVHGRIGSACLKDCNRLAELKENLWDSFKTVPAPTGCIPFAKYAEALKELDVVVPHSLHYEFDIPHDDPVPTLKRELDYYKGLFA